MTPSSLVSAEDVSDSVAVEDRLAGHSTIPRGESRAMFDVTLEWR
jgi:hypothetical protein